MIFKHTIDTSYGNDYILEAHSRAVKDAKKNEDGSILYQDFVECIVIYSPEGKVERIYREDFDSLSKKIFEIESQTYNEFENIPF